MVSVSTPPPPQRLQLLPEAGLALPRAAPAGADAISPEQTVRALEYPRQWHEQNPLLGPAGFRGEGEDLGG